jgi:anti-sigma factor ChrR (cupin superfamily)
LSAHVDESLWEYALGVLSPGEREEIERHLRDCAACTVELRAARETVAAVAMDLPPVAPSSEVLDRLMASTESRYEGLVTRLSGMWDLASERVRELLEWMKTATWEPSGIPGVDVLHLAPGPKAAHADAGFVRFAPGTQFPFHDHIGDELQLIMDGMMIDDKGVEFRVGDVMWKPVGTAHAFTVGPEGCLIGLSLVGGIVIDGVKYAVKN